MKEVLLRLCWKLKTSLGSRRGSPTKFLPISQRLVRIRCLTLGPKGEEVEIYIVRKLLIPSTVRSIWVNILLGKTIALGVERVDIK